MKITATQLKEICPNMTLAKAEKYVPFINQSIVAANLTTVKRLAFFLAQLAHESLQFYYTKEVASGKDYEPSKNPSLAKKLGNTTEGDGIKYKGRSFIQVTGKANYGACGEFLGLDLINHPELLEEPVNAFKASVWYWISRDLNKYADSDNFKGLTKAINGAYNGLEDRVKYLNKALDVLKDNK